MPRPTGRSGPSSSRTSSGAPPSSTPHRPAGAGAVVRLGRRPRRCRSGRPGPRLARAEPPSFASSPRGARGAEPRGPTWFRGADGASATAALRRDAHARVLRWRCRNGTRSGDPLVAAARRQRFDLEWPRASIREGCGSFSSAAQAVLRRRQAGVLEGTWTRRGVVRRERRGPVVGGGRRSLCRQRALGRCADRRTASPARCTVRRSTGPMPTGPFR